MNQITKFIKKPIYRIEDESRLNTKYLIFAKLIAASLAVMYGVVPVLVELSGLFEAPYAFINLWFSLALLIFILALPTKELALSRLIIFTEKRNSVLTITIFISALYSFYLFPWHDDRESIGASLSAFFRALWFVVGISYMSSPERTRLVLMIATVILMYIDQSRTYFLLLLIILAAKSEYKKTALIIGLTLATALGAIRSSDSGGGFDLLIYGIIGEGYNATKTVGQIHAVSHIPIDVFSHIASTLLQPVTLPFDILMSKIFSDSYKLQDFYLYEAITLNLSEIFNPMGGWYVVGDFVYYGYIGILLMWIYIYITWYLSRRLLDTKLFPYGAFFVFIAIKATPFIYWKFIFYIIAVSLVYKLLTSFRIGLNLTLRAIP
jgi:hypothetical protein